jgi:hypothetical protein
VTLRQKYAKATDDAIAAGRALVKANTWENRERWDDAYTAAEALALHFPRDEEKIRAHVENCAECIAEGRRREL